MPAPFVVRDHYVDLAAGRFASTTAEDLDRIFRNIATSGAKTLVVHFHGGLNPRDEAIQRVSDLGPTYAQAGAYPLFFVWESWVSEVISNGFVAILQEPIFRAAVDRVGKLLFKKIADGQKTRAGGLETDAERRLRVEIEKARTLPGHDPRVPAELRQRVFAVRQRDERELLNAFLNDPVIAHETRAIANELSQAKPRPAVRGGGAEVLDRRETRMRPELKDQLKQASGTARWDPTMTIARALVDVTVKVFTRYAQGREHGLIATVVEEVLRQLYFVEGWFSWMKVQIEDAFQPDPLRYGGTALLTHLTSMRDAGRPLRVVLVGHSAGSIYCCNVVDQARTVVPEQKFDVAFLTPAVTLDRFGRMLATNGAAIQRLHNIALCDALERKDRWIPVVADAYPASLLYFTAGVMERDAAQTGDVPLVGMQRFYDGSVPVATTAEREGLDYLRLHQERLCWAGDSMESERRMMESLTAEHHSGFAEEQSVRAIVGRFIGSA